MDWNFIIMLIKQIFLQQRKVQDENLARQEESVRKQEAMRKGKS